MKVYDKNDVDVTFSDRFMDLEQLTSFDAIPIPDGATNGNMIKALLKPYILQISEDYELSKKVRVAIGVGTPILEFDIKWWNAPYKGVEE